MRFFSGIVQNTFFIFLIFALLFLPNHLEGQTDINRAVLEETEKSIEKASQKVTEPEEQNKDVLEEQARSLIPPETPVTQEEIMNEAARQEEVVAQDVAQEFIEEDQDTFVSPDVIDEVAAPEEIGFEDTDELLSEVASQSVGPADKEKTYEKSPALEPSLMIRGEPIEEAAESARKEKIKGLIIPEKHPVKRRRYLFRWVLETESGSRIPLKSNLKLLTLVRKEELLDGPVMLTGYYLKSALNENLKFFVVENATPAGESKTDTKKTDKATKKR
jgi:hypothetical protein